MKNLERTAMLIAVIILLGVNALGQKRNNKSNLSKPETADSSGPKVICTGESIPKGFVIMGEKLSDKCGGKLGLTIKKPSDTEIVCEDSPIPSGFTVMQQDSSAACQKQNVNPLTNALLIKLNGVPSSGTNSNNQKTTRRVFEESRAYEEALESRAEESRRIARRAVAISEQGRPSGGQIEDAIRQRRVIIGMKKDEVLRAIGRPTSVTTVTNAAGVVMEQWYYRRFQGSLFFDGEILETMVDN